MKHLLARTAATLAALVFAPIAARAQTYTVTDLTPAGYTNTEGLSISGNAQVGDGNTSNSYHALLWHGTPASVIDLHPDGFKSSIAWGVDGGTQVGLATGTDGNDHAVLWHGTAASVVNLQPAGFDYSAAYGVSGNTQVGFGAGNDFARDGHALLWHGTAESVVDLNPPGFTYTNASSVSGDTQLGEGGGPLIARHALLWHGTAASVVDLNPAGFRESEGRKNDANSQVGGGTTINGGGHALLWHGTAASAVDLHPTNLTGFVGSLAFGVFGNTQVGEGVPAHSGAHALVWHGTPDSAVDLSNFLPKSIVESYALNVSANGDILGVGVEADYKFHAFLWRPNKSVALGIASLTPDTVNMTRPALTLTVNGTQFARSTVVRWNGQTLATTYASPLQVTARVPAFLVAQSGTADITVQTPHVATSGAATFHIRPLLSSVSPASVNAGSAAFTLTVNGSGYTADAIVVFKGTNLATQFVSSTKLTALVPAALVAAHGRKSVMVTLPHVATSRGMGFDVTP